MSVTAYRFPENHPSRKRSGVTAYRFPANHTAPQTLPEAADALVNQAKKCVSAMSEGSETAILEQSLEMMQVAEGICRLYPENVVERLYLYVVERHAARGEYSETTYEKKS